MQGCVPGELLVARGRGQDLHVTGLEPDAYVQAAVVAAWLAEEGRETEQRRDAAVGEIVVHEHEPAGEGRERGLAFHQPEPVAGAPDGVLEGEQAEVDRDPPELR